MASRIPKPKVAVELESGDYIVSVHPAFEHGRGYRVWRIIPDGRIEGYGRTLRRVAVWDTVNLLTREAQEREGIR